MDSDIEQLLSDLRAAAGNDPLVDAVTSKFRILTEKVYLLEISQDEITRAYQSVVLIGHLIQKVSIDGQPLPPDFGLHFASAIDQLIVAQARAFNARNDQP